MMPSDCGLTDADKADIHARLASWFGDDRQAFLVSHLVPVVDRIKSEACVEMSRTAYLAERRAEDAEAEVERLRSTLAEVRSVFDLQCPPMMPEKYVDHGAWVAHSWWNAVLGNILNRADLLDALTDGRWEKVSESKQGSGDDAWLVSVHQERGCDHEWLDRPESDTRVCELCAEER